MSCEPGECTTLSDKVALVTGATTPLGQALVESMGRAGASIAFCSSDRPALRDLQQRMDDCGATSVGIACDIRDEDDIIRLIHRVIQHYRRIDILVNAASVIGPRTPLVNFPPERWRNAIDTNLTGVFLVIREVLPWMTQAGAGAIVNVGGPLPAPGKSRGTVWAASLFGLEALTRTLAAEVQGAGIHIAMIESAPPKASGHSDENGVIDWADVIAQLAAGEARRHNGQRIPVHLLQNASRSALGAASRPS